MSLSGDLADFGVEQVLRLLELSKSTGRLTVRAGDGKVTVDARDGNVVALKGSDEDGEVALGLAVMAREGTFTYSSGPVEEAVAALARSLDELVERARAKAAEALEVRASVPSDDARFRMSERAMTGSAFTLTAAELRVLTAVGGGKSVKDLRRSVRLPPQAIRSLLHSLVRKELVERTEERAEIVVATAKARPKRARKPAEAAVEVVEVTPGPAAPEAAEIETPALRDELDVRLAALAALAPEAESAAAEVAPEEPIVEEPAVEEAAGEELASEEPADDRLVVVTPTTPTQEPAAAAAEPDATVVFRLHYLPETAAPPPPIEAPPAPKRRGIFDMILRRGPANAADQAAEMLDIPSPAELGALANALYEEFVRTVDARSQLGSFADRASGQAPEGIPARLGRIYASRPIGSRVPTADGAIDTAQLGRGQIAPAQVLPYLALLVRDIRDEMRRSLGVDEATSTYDATVAKVFGRDVATPTRILRVAERPLRGRLTITTGPAAGPFELRDRTYVIGRSPGCDIVMNDPSVSGRHAQLVPDLVGFRLSDLGSTNGTRVNGEKLKEGDRVLKGGEQIGLGDMVLRYEHIATAG